MLVVAGICVCVHCVLPQVLLPLFQSLGWRGGLEMAFLLIHSFALAIHNSDHALRVLEGTMFYLNQQTLV